MTGIKHDRNKPDLSLVPYAAVGPEAEAFMFGAKKYGRYNYLGGLSASRLIAAALRHVFAYMDGEDTDYESGVHSLGHARACLAMLLHLEETGGLIDDRCWTDPQNEEESTGVIAEVFSVGA